MKRQRKAWMDWSEEKLIDEVLAEMKRLNRDGSTSISRYDGHKNPDLPSAAKVVKMFGSWRKANEAAGLIGIGPGTSLAVEGPKADAVMAAMPRRHPLDDRRAPLALLANDKPQPHRYFNTTTHEWIETNRYKGAYFDHI